MGRSKRKDWPLEMCICYPPEHRMKLCLQLATAEANPVPSVLTVCL